MSEPLQTAECSIDSFNIEVTRDFIEHIEDFPADDLSLTASTMKDTPVSLKGSLHTDMISFMPQVKADVTFLGARVYLMESKMGDFAIAHNEYVDTHNDAEEEMLALKEKLANLEDGFHRNQGS